MNPHGVGLGLTLCKIICENFGGDIAVFSDGTNGTTFEFRFRVKYSYQGQDREESPSQNTADIDLLKTLGISENQPARSATSLQTTKKSKAETRSRTPPVK